MAFHEKANALIQTGSYVTSTRARVFRTNNLDATAKLNPQSSPQEKLCLPWCSTSSSACEVSGFIPSIVNVPLLDDTCAQLDDREVVYSENGAFATKSAKLGDV
jgi:hypothetical protein